MPAEKKTRIGLPQPTDKSEGFPAIPFNPEISQNDWEKMLRMKNRLRKGKDWISFAHLNAAMAIADPKRASEFEITDEDWAKMMMERQSHTGGLIGPAWELVVLINANMLISDPERAIELKITDERWNDMIKSRDARRTDNLYHMEMFAKISTAMKISDPTKNLEITEEDWKRMEELRQTYKEKEYWVEFAVMNMHMVILAAKTVKIAENGIEIGTEKK